MSENSSSHSTTGKKINRSSVRSTNEIAPASMIFRNLLIVEDDLRRQWRSQQQLRKKFTGFLICIILLMVYCVWNIFFSTDSVESIKNKRSNGNSHFFWRYLLISLLITMILFRLSGEYKRTITEPRRFLTQSNKGLRQFNVRLVRVPRSQAQRASDIIRLISNKLIHITNCILVVVRIFLPYYNNIKEWLEKAEINTSRRVGAVDVKLVLNPRSFGAEVREGWEIYRDEFWAREGARRRQGTTTTT
ncbi:hypothetical protein TBLA_0E02150 [Henningerozyma blattae CBS 6284]|uniref:Spo7-like protein n=1 Tax=Henningerozyma blattae (strain ATCC 34711 / CBS 6284 / DSM 70876 / NBRC 10599 / NRRL Y-10934 / UCD 77-7) TaxID=1071380 RepID=I2H4G6_HENB6|nr:hypothetical protein TBLA_0E02150 [Tetrapisispora blattae CBS 6284]CCH61268.1 hypothetical protein TBLA_0E02150 [Tetrapisispora blattae CBS 6284]